MTTETPTPARKRPGPKTKAEKAAIAAAQLAQQNIPMSAPNNLPQTVVAPWPVVKPKLKYFRVSPNVPIPEFKTRQAACWDLAFCPAGKREYSGFNEYNAPFTRPFNDGTKLYIGPKDRILVPTGLFLDIPEGYSVRVHARSGTSLKQGLILGNQEGVIDSDYVDELFIMLYNISTNGFLLQPGERLAQAELIKREDYILWEVSEMPAKKTNRTGGFGSTGV